MRFLSTALLFLLAAPFAAAQSPDAPPKYWVFFADRPVADAATPEPSRVSARAADRRALRGSIDRPQLDAPVPESYQRALQALGIEPIHASRWFNAVSARLSPDEVRRVEALPFVRRVQPVAKTQEEAPTPLAVPLAPAAPAPALGGDYGASAFQLGFINADRVLEAGYDGTGVRVAFLDTRFDFDHPVFAELVADGRLIATEDFTEAQGTQSSFHGLSVSSVAVGNAPGTLVAPGHGAEVLAATTEFAPTETHQEEDNLVAGLEWAEANGADVVNISLGYSTFDPGEGDFTYADMDGNTTLITRAADLAVGLGVAVVTSAGNEGNRSWRYITAPADADSVITVGAANADASRAGFSSFGPTADGRIKPDVSAFGVSAFLARENDSYGFASGTSFSAPTVAGVVAQLLQAQPALTPIEVREALRQTASQADAPDNALGWGIVDAEAAVLRVLNTAGEPEAPAADRKARLYPSVLQGATSVTAEWSQTRAGRVQLDVFDVLGRRHALLLDRSFGAGPHRLQLPVPALAAGAYVYRLVSPDGRSTGRLTAVR